MIALLAVLAMHLDPRQQFVDFVNEHAQGFYESTNVMATTVAFSAKLQLVKSGFFLETRHSAAGTEEVLSGTVPWSSVFGSSCSESQYGAQGRLQIHFSPHVKFKDKIWDGRWRSRNKGVLETTIEFPTRRDATQAASLLERALQNTRPVS